MTEANENNENVNEQHQKEQKQLEHMEAIAFSFFRKYGTNRKLKFSIQFIEDAVIMSEDDESFRMMSDDKQRLEIDNALTRLCAKKLIRLCYIKNRGIRQDDSPEFQLSKHRIVGYKLV